LIYFQFSPQIPYVRSTSEYPFRRRGAEITQRKSDENIWLVIFGAMVTFQLETFHIRV